MNRQWKRRLSRILCEPMVDCRGFCVNRQWMRKLSRILCEPVEGGTEDAGRVVWVSCLGPVSSVSVEHYSRFLLGGKKGREGVTRLDC